MGLFCASAPVPLCEHATIEAVVADDLRTVEGTVTCVAQSHGPLAVATYPRILRRPDAYDDINSPWYYPNGFSPADMHLWHNHRALLGDGAWQYVGTFDRAQAVSLRFVTHIPERNGLFGRREQTAYLLGGWHPAFGTGDGLPATTYDYRITLPTGAVGFVGTQPYGRKSARTQVGQHRGRYVPILAARQAQVRIRQDTVMLVPQPVVRANLEQPGSGLAELFSQRDAYTLLETEKTLAKGAGFARQLGVDTRPLIVVVAPLRAHMVEPFDGGLVVSDRAFHVVSWELMQQFHRASLWREQMATYVRAHSDRVEDALPPEVAADAIGSALRDRLFAAEYASREYAPDLLERVAVIPEIDALIFAPQVPFNDTYYNAIDETPRKRERLDDFFHSYPRGKLLYEKLQDRLQSAQLREWVRRYLSHHENLLHTIRDVAGFDTLLAMQPWLGPFPRFNYALTSLSARTQTRVRVEATGPDAQMVREPITVQLTDVDGHKHRRSTQGPGEVVFDNARPYKSVQLDPDGRLAELWHDPGVLPRYDNRVPKRWRFLLNDISGLFAVTNQQISLAIDFTLRRINDLRFDFDVAAFYAPGMAGAQISAARNFGAEITPLRLAQSVSLTLTATHLREELDVSTPGDQVGLGVDYSYDSRLGRYWDFRGTGLDASISGNLGQDTLNRGYAYIYAGVAGLQLVPLGFNAAWVSRLRVDGNLGAAPPQNRLRLGGRYLGARGYENDEARGERRVLVSQELRHTLQGASRNDAWGLLMLTRLEGAFFADAVYLPVNRMGCHQSWFYDVGYGVRFDAEILNLSPVSLQLDVGLPLNRCPDMVDVKTPVTVYLSIIQSFASF